MKKIYFIYLALRKISDYIRHVIYKIERKISGIDE